MGRQSKPLPLEDVLDLHERLVITASSHGLALHEVGLLTEDGEAFPVIAEGASEQHLAFAHCWALVRPARTRAIRAYFISDDNPDCERYRKLGPAFDDSQRDKAQVELKLALDALRRAQRAFHAHNAPMAELCKGMRTKKTVEQYGEEQALALADAVDTLIRRTRTFEGLPEVTTFAEWEAVVSEIAHALSAANVETAVIAEIVYGSSSDESLRALDERLRRAKTSK